MDTDKVKMKRALYEFTSQEAFTVPIYRFIGQENSFTIINNLQKTQVDLSTAALDSLLDQLNKYKEYLKTFAEKDVKEE